MKQNWEIPETTYCHCVHFGNIFQGNEASAVFVDAIFQISDDT
jgi:hypothetical protein